MPTPTPRPMFSPTRTRILAFMGLMAAYPVALAVVAGVATLCARLFL